MISRVRRADKTRKIHACMLSFCFKTWKIQTTCMEKSYKIILHFEKVLQSLPATWKSF